MTPNTFDVLGVQPLMGRTFRPEENQPGSSGVVILSDRFWRQQLGGAPTALGQTVRINEEPHTIVGVMPPTFQIHDEDASLRAATDRPESWARLPARRRAVEVLASAWSRPKATSASSPSASPESIQRTTRASAST